MDLYKRKIAVVTGIRSDYTGVYPIMKEISRQPAMVLQVMVTGAHLIGRFKNVKKNLEDEFENIKYVDMNLEDDSYIATAKGLGKGVVGLAECFDEFKPDIVAIFGDRIEPLAAAQSAAVMNIPVAHIHAGDVSMGNVDESIRYAITRFAHIHFAATENSAKRLIQSGEERWRIFVTGSSQIDMIKSIKLMNKTGIYHKFGLTKPYILVLQNPITTSLKESVESTKTILEALSEIDITKVIIYPNSDPGSEKIIEIIEKYRLDTNFKIFKNLPPIEYLSLLKYCVCLVGNSTSGIIEAPVFKVLFVNVGTRQKGRDATEDVIRITDWNKDIVKENVLDILEGKRKPKSKRNPYGTGGASKKIVEILKKIDINEKLLRKSYHHLLSMEAKYRENPEC